MKNIFLSFILVFTSSIVWAAKPNNIVPLEMLTVKDGKEIYRICTGMRLRKDIIITAAHCLTQSEVSDTDSPLCIDFKYSNTAKEWIVSITNMSSNICSDSNGNVYFHTQNFNPENSTIEAEKFGDLAIIKINGPINIINAVMNNKNIKNLPPQIRNMMLIPLQTEQKQHNSNYNSFMNISLENYKVFALQADSNKVPEFFRTMTIYSYFFPSDENRIRYPVEIHNGKFKGIAKRSSKIIGWDLKTKSGESGSPLLDTKNKRFFGSGSGDYPDTGGALETMKIDTNVCNGFFRKFGIKCEIENPPQPVENNRENNQLKPIGKNIEKPIIKPTKK